jgi:hypothetical protein
MVCAYMEIPTKGGAVLSTLRAYVVRHHLAILALFIVLGGTSYAAVRLPAKSVGTKQLKSSAVTRVKLARGAVTSSKVKDGSLLPADFARGQLPVGPAGQTGPAGAPGERGSDGAPGSPGISGLHIVTADSAADTTNPKVVVAPCPSGEAAVGGGGQVFTTVPAQQDALRTSGPVVGGDTQPTSGVPTGWRVNAVQDTADTTNAWTARAYALCATVAP